MLYSMALAMGKTMVDQHMQMLVDAMKVMDRAAAREVIVGIDC